MKTNKLFILGMVLFVLVVLTFTWSTALTLLLGGSLKNLNPWAVVSFISSYGFSGPAGTLLFRSFMMALLLTGGAGVILARWIYQPSSPAPEAGN